MLLKNMTLMSILSMIWWRKNIIMMLLSLELLLLSMFTLISFMNSMNLMITLILILMMMVTGSSLGLSMLVSMSRSHKSVMSKFIFNLTYDKINYTYSVYN